jgi:prophage maintenance system killer protein
VRFDEVCFLDVDDVHALHDDALAVAGGKAGVLNEALVISAVMAPQNSYCGTLAEMAATVAYGIEKTTAIKMRTSARPLAR